MERVTVKRVAKGYKPPSGYRLTYMSETIREVRYHPYHQFPAYPPYQVINEHGALVAECDGDEKLWIEAINNG